MVVAEHHIPVEDSPGAGILAVDIPVGDIPGMVRVHPSLGLEHSQVHKQKALGLVRILSAWASRMRERTLLVSHSLARVWHEPP